MSEAILIDTFTRLRQRFRALASRILHDEAEAEDALQEAFCRLWPRRESIDTPEMAKALAITTIRHLSIDRWRRTQQTPHFALNEAVDSIPDTDDTAEREAWIAEVVRLVESRLTDLQRHILYRKEYDGLTCEAIAQELQMQPTAVRMQLSRARKAIREAWEQQV